jgi:hypothetical protein
MKRSRTKVEDVINEATTAKDVWVGHVARLDIRKWSRKTKERIPRDKKIRGRQKQRWRDEIKQAGNTWT